MSTDAVAVELSNVPVSAVLVTVTAAPIAAVTRTDTVVPMGILDAARLIDAGLTGAVAKFTSGTVRLPVGAAGVATPAIDVIRNVGRSDGIGAPGNWVNEPPPAPIIAPV